MTAFDFFVLMLMHQIKDRLQVQYTKLPEYNDQAVDLSKIKHHKERINKIRKLSRLFHPKDVLHCLIRHQKVRGWNTVSIRALFEFHEFVNNLCQPDQLDPLTHKHIDFQLTQILSGSVHNEI
jgi:hypothetical protein